MEDGPDSEPILLRSAGGVLLSLVEAHSPVSL